MPNPNPPPTPGSSSDIRGKEGAKAPPTFKLPPTAFEETERAIPSSRTSSATGSDPSYRPVSPASPGDFSRKRSNVRTSSVITQSDVALPPPPTRSRKIIQMKPQHDAPQESAVSASNGTGQSPGKGQNNTQTSGKRKRNNPNATAAGRKIARKTAHSLIERRRRSKMNEEFGVLKDMIPACRGQEMHKLAILQASIEYLRYLEECVVELKAQKTSPPIQPQMSSTRHSEPEVEEDDDEEMADEEEARSAVSTPSTAPRDPRGSMVSLPSLSQITSTSPSAFSIGAARHYSVSSVSQPSYSPYIHSNQTSPAFGPQLAHVSNASSLPAPHSASRENFVIGSPALKASDADHHLRQTAEGGPDLSDEQHPSRKAGRSEHELDREATTALLMLNHDRRNWSSSNGGRSRAGNTGMSVRDLLSG